MNQYIVTVPKYKSKSRNIMRILMKMDECFKYYNPVVIVRNTDCPHSEIVEYLEAFHNINDYKIANVDDTSYISKTIDPEMKITLEYGDSDTELPFKEEVEEEKNEFKVTEDGCKAPIEIKKSNNRTRQVMSKINEELYSKDSWKELDGKGCCVVAVGNLKTEDEIDLEYVKNNINHSSVRHNCVNIEIIRTEDKTAVVVVLTWKN